MTGNTANIEVAGSAAANIARGLLNGLGIPPSDIEAADITVVVNGDGDTEVALVADGPNAGDITAEMFGGVEWDDYEVASIDADVTERDEPAAPSTTDEDTSSSPGSSGFQPQVTPLAGKVDPQYVGFPGEPPGRIREHTQLHVIADILMEWYADHDADWVSGGALAEYEPNPLSETQTQNGSSRLFRNKGLVVRRQQPEGDGRKYEYHPTKQLSEEATRLGEYSMPDVEETRDKRTPDDVDAEP
jgi:hypothetical protein